MYHQKGHTICVCYQFPKINIEFLFQAKWNTSPNTHINSRVNVISLTVMFVIYFLEMNRINIMKCWAHFCLAHERDYISHSNKCIAVFIRWIKSRIFHFKLMFPSTPRSFVLLESTEISLGKQYV